VVVKEKQKKSDRWGGRGRGQTKEGLTGEAHRKKLLGANPSMLKRGRHETRKKSSKMADQQCQKGTWVFWGGWGQGKKT